MNKNETPSPTLTVLLTLLFLLSPFLNTLVEAVPPKARTHRLHIILQTAISGTVTDTQGNPILGANVIIAESNTGTVTDLNGTYRLTAKPGDVLVFSALGFSTQRITVSQNIVINVQLEEDVTQLEEVTLNAGYYTVSEKERTGSIAKVTAREIEQQPVSNPLAALQGRVAGAQVVQSSGIAGADFNIQIRGRNSIRSRGNDPLYVVDGVPYASATLGEQSASGILPGLGFNPLNTLNPMDIESIEILKDADATAIYGSRGANGVVLINTKNGRSTGTQFNLDLQTGMGQVSSFLDVLSTPDYLNMRREAYSNDGIDPIPVNAYDINGTWDQGKQTHWQKKLFGKTAYFNNIRASISGGSDRTQFLISGNFNSQTGVFPGDYANKKISGLANVSHRSPDDRLNLQFSTNFTWNDNDLPAEDITFTAIGLAPNAPELYNEDGSLNWENSTWRNPLYTLQGLYRTGASTLITNATMVL